MWISRDGKYKILSVAIVATVIIIAGASVAAGYNLVAQFVGNDDIIRGCVESDGSLRLISSEDSCTGGETAIRWNVTGPEGPVGPEGTAGPAGDVGPNGTAGQQGAAGLQGPAGAQGDEGLQGPPGETGPEGAAGSQGTPGDRGPSGAKGPSGPAGPEGLQGPSGLGSGDTLFPIVTNRIFTLANSSTPPLILVDTDDGSVVRAFESNKMDLREFRCDGSRALLLDWWAEDYLLIDVVTGETIVTFEGPTGMEARRQEFSCTGSLMEGVINRGQSDLLMTTAGVDVVLNRAVLGWGWEGQCPSACQALLINSDTGEVIDSYAGWLDRPMVFNCSGDRLFIRDVGIINSLTGEVVSSDIGKIVGFSCP
ncbi:MAG: collagen-like protein [Chloroflexi bacterium]|nr:collagen-like protein [Chloroflexota bacterium]